MSRRKPLQAGERWTPAEDSVLGTAPDREVAKKLKRPPGGIQSRRRKLGVLLRGRRANGPWTPVEVKLLGLATDREVAEALGRPIKAVRLKRQRLGVRPFQSLEYRVAGSGLFASLPPTAVAGGDERPEPGPEFEVEPGSRVRGRFDGLRVGDRVSFEIHEGEGWVRVMGFWPLALRPDEGVGNA